MSRLNIHLFGKFSVECDQEVLCNFNAYKVQELFTYLLVYRNRPHARETLAGLLWDNATTEKSRKYLRQAIWHLQTAFDTQKGWDVSGITLQVDHDWVQIETNETVWLDVAILEEAFRLIEGVESCDLTAEQAVSLQVAVELYRGDLLEGCYQDWCLYERELLQNKYLMILDKLLGYCLSHQEFDAGLGYGALILRYDRARERTHQLLMRLYHLAGDRTGALRQYERCASALREELGVEPDKQTIALYEDIRGNQATNPVDDILTIDATTSLPEVLSRLKRLQAMLARVQQHVREDIKAVELGFKPSKQNRERNARF
jgi:DNA-binding SARP family transcriptional activator